MFMVHLSFKKIIVHPVLNVTMFQSGWGYKNVISIEGKDENEILPDDITGSV